MDAGARIVLCCLSFLLSISLVTGAEQVPRSLRADARLAAVDFVDAERGWAAGDRGVVWSTTDGGKTWQAQNSGVDCTLSSVCFLDAKNGWAAGGLCKPYSRLTTGVVLQTRDGGKAWSPARGATLPQINRIGLLDATHGWAIGQGSALYASGVLLTEDGGRTWSGASGELAGSWLAGDFVDPVTAAVAGRASALAIARRGEIREVDAVFGRRALKGMRLGTASRGWLVGDGGLVLSTGDLGRSWQTITGELPDGLAENFDLSAVAVRGKHIWAAGTPGTRVLTSHDAGESWKLVATPSTVPLCGLSFVDDQRGWAVGELGTILATRDGGETWQLQHSGGARAALAGFYARAEEIPYELIARLGADEGYFAAIELVADDTSTSGRLDRGDCQFAVREASLVAGAIATGSCWRFPLPESQARPLAEQTVDAWDRANDGAAMEKLERHIVERLRMWRPSVVFTVAADARQGDPLKHLVNQVVLAAVEHAADPRRFPDQIAVAGLAPWKVQKVYAGLPPGENGATTVSSAQLALRLGLSLGEVAAQARALVQENATPPPLSLGFRLLVDHLPQESGKRDFFSGIPLSPGSDARRRIEEVADNQLDAMRRQAQRRRNLQAILAQAESTDNRDGRFLAQLGDETKQMEEGRGAEVLFQLAEFYRQRGRWELAAECFDMVATRYEKNPLAARSLVWLVQYYASAEAAWRNRSNERVLVQQVTAAAPAQARKKSGEVTAAAHTEQAEGRTQNVRGEDSRAARAIGYAKQLEGLELSLAAEPNLRFPLAVAQREQGLPRQAERYFTSLRHGRPHDQWWATAQTEMWLIEQKAQPPKELWNCAPAPAKPHLDGQLDEAIWRSATPIKLHGQSKQEPTDGARVLLSYDDEFLYLAASCQRSASFRYAPFDQPRPRDADLSDQDRIEVSLDVDRDQVVRYSLTIDHRGWTAENCWGDTTWNPQWFVAKGGDEQTWTVEAAIPLAELTGKLPKPKHVWSVSIQRIIPGAEVQTPTHSTNSAGDAVGYLLFE